MFSVLMSVYYKENSDYLDSSLNSIFNQTILPNEVVIVKDGELTRELDDIISKYKNKFDSVIQIVEIKQNVGLGEALNIGLKNCKYENVIRMDTDDICVNTRFEKILKVLEQEGVSLVGSNAIEFEKDTTSNLRYRIFPEKHEDIKKFARVRAPFLHPTIGFKKSAVLQVGGYKSLLFFEDYYLFLRMLKQGISSYNIQENLLYFRGNKESFKRRGGYNYIKYEMKAFMVFYKEELIEGHYCIFNILHWN